MLHRREASLEPKLHRIPFVPFLLDRKVDAVSAEQIGQIVPASPGEGDVFGKILSAADDPRGGGCRETHLLFLVEPGFWKAASRLIRLSRGDGRPAFSTKSRWERTARTSAGSGLLMGNAAGFRDGG